jgi:type II secretory pathway component PulF
MKKTFWSDTAGIVIGMVVMIVTDITVGIMWIVSMPAVVMMWNIITPSLPTSQLPTMNMLNNVCGWTLLVLVIGTLAYGAVLAFKRDPIDVSY